MLEVAMEARCMDLGEPRFEPPYTVRAFQPGDATTWHRIQESTGIYGSLQEDLFAREFGREPPGRRQLFLLHGKVPVGTGTAWHGPPRRADHWGRLHWMAIDPKHQRRGLATNLVRQLFKVFRERGCTGVYLTTGAENRPALALYRRLGLHPWIRSAEESRFWEV